MEFGFTNDPSILKETVKFFLAACDDGWKAYPTYGDHEPINSHATLEKDGFNMMISMRDNTKGNNPYKYRYECDINIWGPDGLAIDPPKTYDMIAIRKGLRVCGYCGMDDVTCTRVGFAGRCCVQCLPSVKPKVEYRGWCD